MQPSTLTLIPSYRCTAQCRQCCTESNPRLPGKVDVAGFISLLDEAIDNFPSLKQLVVTGGECFLLGDSLNRLIGHAASRGLCTRAVTNGYWATRSEVAAERAEGLESAGLIEINFSTGDEHQRFVPFGRVARGAIACASRGIRSLIVVEGHLEATFRGKDVFQDPRIRGFLVESRAAPLLSVMENVWIPFRRSSEFEYDRPIVGNGRISGCENIFGNMVITPSKQLASCCGLTMEYIPEMKLGNLDGTNMPTLYEGQLRDFMKIWLYVDGPRRILEFAAKKNPSIVTDGFLDHPCQACAWCYKSSQVRRTLRKCFHEVVDDVFLRYEVKKRLTGQGSSNWRRENASHRGSRQGMFR